MGALPAKILPRLGQLIRMLASDQDGEALAAARALSRTLVADGKSLHDLAEVVEAGQTPAPSNPYFDYGWEPPEPAHQSPPTWNDLRDFERRDWLSTFVRKLDIPDKAEMAALVRLRSDSLSTIGMWRPTRKQLELFTRLMERAWKIGVRP